MKLIRHIIWKIKSYFWKRKINKIWGYKAGELTSNRDYSSAYPNEMRTFCYYHDTDSCAPRKR